MCDTCEVAAKIEAHGVAPELLDQFAEQITDKVIDHLTETHELMIVTLMEQLGVKELRIRGRKVREVSQKLDTGRLSVKGEETDDREEFVYTVSEDTSKPEVKEQEDEFSALLRALFEG